MEKSSKAVPQRRLYHNEANRFGRVLRFGVVIVFRHTEHEAMFQSKLKEDAVLKYKNLKSTNLALKCYSESRTVALGVYLKSLM